MMMVVDRWVQLQRAEVVWSHFVPNDNLRSTVFGLACTPCTDCKGLNKTGVFLPQILQEKERDLLQLMHCAYVGMRVTREDTGV